MNTQNNVYAAPATVASYDTPTRAQFIRKTYYHLAGALGLFTLLTFFFCTTAVTTGMAGAIISALSGWGWLAVMAVFMVTSWIAEKWALSSTSKTTQYAGLSLYTLAQSLIFTPLILMVFGFLGLENSIKLLGQAGAITGCLFGGITLIAFTTKKDFSFLGGILKVGGFVALGVIVVSMLFGFSLGILFSSIMVIFAGGSILYSTSNLIHNYRTDQYVAASLGLFASIALMLWYVINILLSLASGGD